MTSDPWGGFDAAWEAQAATRRAEEAVRHERERKALAQLLCARGHAEIAALVAMCGFATYQVDNWDGGQYEAELSVPPAHYDSVSGEVREIIDAAARAVVGDGHYQSLRVVLLIGDAESGWDRDFLDWFRKVWDAREQQGLEALPGSDGDTP